MNLDNVKHVYNPGEVITCTAEGNPEPEIRWVDDESGDEVADSGILVINAFMEGTQTYSCLATNVVRGVTYSRGAHFKWFWFRVSGACFGFR